METIRSIRTFNNACDVVETFCAPYVPMLPNPKIVEISRHTPFSYSEVEDYNELSQAYDFDLDLLIDIAIKTGLNPEGMKRYLEGQL